MVRELIRDRFGARLSDVSVGRLLRKLGLSPQRPLCRANQRDEAKVAAWRKRAYPEIQKLAKQQGATISSATRPASASTWSRPSVPRASCAYDRRRVHERRAPHRVSQAPDLRASGPIFLILDGHPVHKSKHVADDVATTVGRSRLFILSSDSPHHNPDAWVWNRLKRHKIGKARVAGPDQFRSLVDRYLRSLQKLPALVRGFFADHNLAYITQA
jgi:hypothetical protein